MCGAKDHSPAQIPHSTCVPVRLNECIEHACIQPSAALLHVTMNATAAQSMHAKSSMGMKGWFPRGMQAHTMRLLPSGSPAAACTPNDSAAMPAPYATGACRDMDTRKREQDAAQSAYICMKNAPGRRTHPSHKYWMHAYEFVRKSLEELASEAIGASPPAGARAKEQKPAWPSTPQQYPKHHRSLAAHPKYRHASLRHRLKHASASMQR